MLIVQPTEHPLHNQPKPQHQRHGGHPTSPTSSTVVFMEPSSIRSGWRTKQKSLFTVSSHPTETFQNPGDINKFNNGNDNDNRNDNGDLRKITTDGNNKIIATKDSSLKRTPQNKTCSSDPTKHLLPSKDDGSVSSQPVSSTEHVDHNVTNILKEANKIISDSYNLVFGNHNNKNQPEGFQEALALLNQAMKMQQQCLGKNHIKVGWTVNFIGTTHWRMSQQQEIVQSSSSTSSTITISQQQQQHCKMALKYFLEARRIFCKSTPTTTTTNTTNTIRPSSSSPSSPSPSFPSRIKSIDRRIECILIAQMKWTSQQVSQFMSSVQQMMEHELRGDQYKALGDTHHATTEYRKARQHGDNLKKYIT